MLVRGTVKSHLSFVTRVPFLAIPADDDRASSPLLRVSGPPFMKEEVVKVSHEKVAELTPLRLRPRQVILGDKPLPEALRCVLGLVMIEALLAS